jgi:hypothetical protein
MTEPGLIALSICLLLAFSAGHPVGLGASKVNTVVVAAETPSTANDSEQRNNPQSRSTGKLCVPETGWTDVDEYHRLRDRLEAGVNDDEELSRIDAELAEARHDCSIVSTAADLMDSLAANWKKQGNPSRAEQLYREAYALLNDDPTDPILEKMALLQDWASFEFAAGEANRAMDLAKLRTTEARKEYDSGKSSKEFSSDVLIDALKFQARLFQKAGLADEADAARQEAEQLAAQQKPCSGLCGFSVRKVK